MSRSITLTLQYQPISIVNVRQIREGGEGVKLDVFQM